MLRVRHGEAHQTDASSAGAGAGYRVAFPGCVRLHEVAETPYAETAKRERGFALRLGERAGRERSNSKSYTTAGHRGNEEARVV